MQPDDDDELRRSPGTLVTAPECYLGLTYHNKAVDTWAVGVTLYHMLFGTYPFLGYTLQDAYDKDAYERQVVDGAILRVVLALLGTMEYCSRARGVAYCSDTSLLASSKNVLCFGGLG
ncbi:hypothetical protein IFM89_020702 [Coptis chinensis]|uniref:Protein kinase domain-containing protein n=1 Tax=Coptis chinensis TaxID=261450 RepID=A0A835H7M7_9MAGN|nr:hypothetical protein IFM89_020702 [Coptis chinensis]